MNDKPLITRYVAQKRLQLILKGLKKFEQKVPKDRMKILDVGCGNGHFVRAIRQKGYNIIGIDNRSPQQAKWIAWKPDYIMDAMDMKFKDNTFDVIISLEVVEHVPCIPEINRVLKRGGLFFCSTPVPGTDWVRSIVVYLGLLENQDFEHHDHVEDLRKAPMKLLRHRKMFLGTSQFAIFTKMMKELSDHDQHDYVGIKNQTTASRSMEKAHFSSQKTAFYEPGRSSGRSLFSQVSKTRGKL